MCVLCDSGKPQEHGRAQLGRRDSPKASTATAAGGGAWPVHAAAGPAHDDDPPRDGGRHGRGYVIRNGHVISMDPAVRDIVRGDEHHPRCPASNTPVARVSRRKSSARPGSASRR
jgi:hypothetical protein